MSLPWIRINTDIFDHPKMIPLVQQSQWRLIVAHLRAMTWSGKHMLDGHIPSYVLGHLGIRRADCDALVTAGLWDPDLDGNGWWIHGWGDYQPTRASLEARKQAGRDNALKRWGK